MMNYLPLLCSLFVLVNTEILDGYDHRTRCDKDMYRDSSENGDCKPCELLCIHSPYTAISEHSPCSTNNICLKWLDGICDHMTQTNECTGNNNNCSSRKYNTHAKDKIRVICELRHNTLQSSNSKDNSLIYIPVLIILTIIIVAIIVIAVLIFRRYHPRQNYTATVIQNVGNDNQNHQTAPTDRNRMYTADETGNVKRRGLQTIEDNEISGNRKREIYEELPDERLDSQYYYTHSGSSRDLILIHSDDSVDEQDTNIQVEIEHVNSDTGTDQPIGPSQNHMDEEQIMSKGDTKVADQEEGDMDYSIKSVDETTVPKRLCDYMTMNERYKRRGSKYKEKMVNNIIAKPKREIEGSTGPIYNKPRGDVGNNSLYPHTDIKADYHDYMNISALSDIHDQHRTKSKLTKQLINVPQSLQVNPLSTNANEPGTGNQNCAFDQLNICQADQKTNEIYPTDECASHVCYLSLSGTRSGDHVTADAHRQHFDSFSGPGAMSYRPTAKVRESTLSRPETNILIPPIAERSIVQGTGGANADCMSIPDYHISDFANQQPSATINSFDNIPIPVHRASDPSSEYDFRETHERSQSGRIRSIDSGHARSTSANSDMNLRVPSSKLA